jgi:hypothetical protein
MNLMKYCACGKLKQYPNAKRMLVSALVSKIEMASSENSKGKESEHAFNQFYTEVTAYQSHIFEHKIFCFIFLSK